MRFSPKLASDFAEKINWGAVIQEHYSSFPLGTLEAYRDSVASIIASGQAVPILARDWSVNRQESADIALGFGGKGILKLRDILACKDPSYAMGHIHLDKGPGDGSMLHRFRNTPMSNPTTTQKQSPFLHIGVGDKLYFTLESILEKCFLEERSKNPHIVKALKVLTQMLQIKLRERWYDTDKTDYAINKWVRKDDTKSFDMNDIYIAYRELCQDTSTIQKIFDETSWQIQSSHIFEWDDTEVLDVDTWYTLLVFLWKTPTEIRGLFNELLLELKKQVESIKRERDKKLTEHTPGEIDFRKSRLKRTAEHYESFYNDLKNRFEIGGTWFSNGIDGITSRESLFQKEFMNGVDNKTAKNSITLNLNRLPDLYFQGFVFGYFTEIQKILDDTQQCMLITAIRSDSHEDDTNFKKDIAWNLKKLTAGWVLITDGVNESFSGRSRIHILQQMMVQRSDEYKAEAIYNPNTMKVCSVLIQRRSNTGYLTPKEKETLLAQWWKEEGIEANICIGLKIAADYASVFIEHTIREKIIASYKWRVEKLQWMHWKIPLLVKKVLEKAGMKHNDTTDQGTREILEEYIHEVLNETFKSQQLGTI
jgi:hypothetical protein